MLHCSLLSLLSILLIMYHMRYQVDASNLSTSPSRVIAWPDGGRGVLHMVSEQPLLVHVQGLYTDEMAEYIQSAARHSGLRPSQVSNAAGVAQQHVRPCCVVIVLRKCTV